MDKHLHKNDWYLIINPTASNGRVKQKWNVIRNLFVQHEIEFQYAFTEYPMHAVELVDEAVKEGYRNFIGVGGDGTNNEVINGLFKQKHVPPAELLYTLFPLGTGNDWIRTHGIPKNPKKWFDKMSKGQIKFHDVGLVLYESKEVMYSRFFVNVAGMAYDAFVVKTAKVEKIGLHSQWAYLMLVMRCLFKFKAKPIKLQIDGKMFEAPFYTINIGICKYSGGGMQMVPHAEPDNGMLALTTANGVTPLNIILNFPKLYGGKVKNYSKAKLESIKTLMVEPSDNTTPTFIEVDGELIGQAPAEFSVQEKAFRVLVPV